MFFLKMISRSFSRQFKRRLLIAVTVCLSATVSVAMLGVVFDVGDKLNAELSTYGSNRRAAEVRCCGERFVQYRRFCWLGFG
mgnify:CR=1 FL=1